MSRSVLRTLPKADDYVVHFDQSLDWLLFNDKAVLSGWFFDPHEHGNGGLRAVIRRPFFSREDVRARRKQSRPDAAAAYPNCGEAAKSGFVFQLPLRLGWNRIVFQVLDHQKRWRSFATVGVLAIPLLLLDQIGLSRTRHFLAHSLRRQVSRSNRSAFLKSRHAALTPTQVELFATSRSNLFMVEIAELVCAGFRDLGLPAQLRLDAIPAAEAAPDTLQLVVAPHEYHQLFLNRVLSPEEMQALTRGVFLFCTEQPETGWFELSLQWARLAKGVADLSALGAAAYQAHGVHARRLGLGFHPVLAHPRLPSHQEREHDVLFLGTLTKRRETFVAQHASFFAARASQVRLVPLDFAKTRTSWSYLEPARRNELLSESRILLNVHHGEQEYFEWHRILLGLANGCCVLSEPCRSYGPLVPGLHFIMVELEHLIPTCEYFLNHPQECARIARAGREFVETNLRQADQCAAFLTGKLDATDPAPVPLPRELRRLLSRRARRQFWRTMRQDLQPRKHGKPAAEATLEERQAAVVKRRAGYRERLAQQGEALAEGNPIFELHKRGPADDHIAPALTILITLFNYAEHIEACLCSAAAAARKLNEPAEILVVNDASTDDSLERVLQWAISSPLSLRIADKRFNTGLADARNLGISLARGVFIFMLDADNLIREDALLRLLALIRTGDFAAAYSLIVRFHPTPDDSIGLLSEFDWDPEILVQRPYIDAMAMFRRDDLLRLGGYDLTLSQVGWFGWEDYEMWLRFARDGLQVAFLPTPLCLYRDHPRSMLKTTNLFQAELVLHLVDRFGDLLDRFEPRPCVFGMARTKLEPSAVFGERKHVLTKISSATALHPP